MKKRGPFSGFKRRGSFSRFEGAALGVISIVALVIAAVVTFSFESGAPQDASSPPSLIAAG
jgi:hypothetical protein